MFSWPQGVLVTLRDEARPQIGLGVRKDPSFLLRPIL